MFGDVAADANVLDWIMAWMLVLLIPALVVMGSVEGFKWFHKMLNRYFR